MSKKSSRKHPDETPADEPAVEPAATPPADDEPAAPPSAPAEPAAAVVAPEDLAQALEQARALADEYLDGWQRSRAEFLNYKKRIEREQEASQALAAASIHTHYLGVVDDLERALKERPRGAEIDAWTVGIEMILHKIEAALEAAGVEPIPAEGQRFDPALHEAISYESSDGFSEGEVIEVVQRGFRLGDRVLRAARVRVAR